jgi:small-conductance mechanosensitive channel
MNEIVEVVTQQSNVWLPRIAGVIAIIIIFYVISKIVKKAILKMTERLNIDNNLSSFLARTSSIILFFLGLVTALGTLGINVSALVAGLGLTGFALGFALKDTISNLLSGVLILLYQPFKIGNTIKISGYQGRVVTIDLRYTELAQEGDKVLIPNSKLFKDPITVINNDVTD